MHYFSTSAEAEADASYDRDLSSLLAAIVNKEAEIEEQRSLLCENDKFDCSEAFRSLDVHGHGYLSSIDLKQFLSKNHVMTRDSEVEFLLFNYSPNHQTISFREFLQLVLPKQDDLLKEQCLSRRRFQQTNQKYQLPFYLEEQISRIFELEIAYIRETEAMKLDIMNNYGWNYRESFKRIAIRGQYHIDKLSFQEFMRKNGYSQLGEQSFQLLLIRFNKDNNQSITMDEFSDAIFPSDFLSLAPNAHSLSQQQPMSPYLRYVKGDQQQFNEFVVNSTQQDQQAGKFRQSDYEFRNDINANTAQKRRQGMPSPRKFLKTSAQYENTFQVEIPQQQLELQKDEKLYPILNQYMTKRLKSPQTAAKTNHPNRQPIFNSSSGQKIFRNTGTEELINRSNQKQAKKFLGNQVNYLVSPYEQNNQFREYTNNSMPYQQKDPIELRADYQQDNLSGQNNNNFKLIPGRQQQLKYQAEQIEQQQDYQNQYAQYQKGQKVEGYDQYYLNQHRLY